MESRQWLCLEQRPVEFITGPYFSVQKQGQCVHGIRIDKYNVVEFRGRVQ